MRSYSQRNQGAEKRYPVRKINLNYIQKISSFRAVNTVHFNYKNNVLVLYWIIDTILLVLKSIQHTDIQTVVRVQNF
jgi:hypothetical protein